jgi:ABC-type phosphate/phosphonate transport system substrate-binding protein
VHFLEQQGMREGRDYRALRFDSDIGKHGDTGTSEVEVVRAVLDGRANAGAIGSPFWNTVRQERLVPEGALRETWSSPAYNHCMFTARPDLDLERGRQFTDALLKMSYENPAHRPILDAEGLHRWLPPHVDGYSELRQAAAQQGFFNPLAAQSVGA